MSGLSDTLRSIAEEINTLADILEGPGVIVSASGPSSDPGSMTPGTSQESSSMVTPGDVPITRANGDPL